MFLMPTVLPLRVAMIALVLGVLVGAMLAGSLVYCCLTVAAAMSWKRQALRTAGAAPPISLMKPLRGAEPGLAENLRSFFRQDYAEYEVLLAVATPLDAATEIARQVMAEYPHVPSRLLYTGESPEPNGKVFALAAMLREARYELLVMSDSDVRAGRNLLGTMAAEMGEPGVGLVTCLYRASAGESIWTRLEALGLNTEFLGGVLVARLLNGVDFALGPALAIRRETLSQVGGFEELRHYLAEDFVMGNRVARLGQRVVMSRAVIEHRLGSQSFASNLSHRLRWARSTRRSRPAGYVGQLFTYPLPLALLLVVAMPAWWPALVLTLMLRAASAAATGYWILRDPLTVQRWYLLPLQDLLSFGAWLGGFFGSSITWRGRRLKILRDGRFESRFES